MPLASATTFTSARAALRVPIRQLKGFEKVYDDPGAKRAGALHALGKKTSWNSESRGEDLGH